MSLRDQLIKAGAASKKQLKKAQHDDRVAKKGKNKQAASNEQQAAEAARQRQIEEQKARDRELNRQREEAKRARERLAQVAEIFATGRLNSARADLYYYFLYQERFAERIMVTDDQVAALAEGRLGIAVAEKESTEFTLLSRKDCERLQSLAPELMLLLF